MCNCLYSCQKEKLIRFLRRDVFKSFFLLPDIIVISHSISPYVRNRAWFSTNSFRIFSDTPYSGVIDIWKTLWELYLSIISLFILFSIFFLSTAPCLLYFFLNFLNQAAKWLIAPLAWYIV